jgi:hypothetical protein
MAKLEKKKIVLDFDDTIVKSKEEVLRQINNTYKINKDISELKDYGFKTINGDMTREEVLSFFENKEFFDNVKLNNGIYEFFEEFKDTYYFIICTKGTIDNLTRKIDYLIRLFNVLGFNIDEWEFLGAVIDTEQKASFDKSKYDFSDCLFAVDDNVFCLESMNVHKKILIKNHFESYWSEVPINSKNYYVVNDFYDIIEMCRFDQKLNEKGIILNEQHNK